MFDVFNISKIATIVIFIFIIAVNVYFYHIKQQNEKLKKEIINEKVLKKEEVNKQKIKDFEEKQKEKKESILKSFKKDKNDTNKTFIDTSVGKHTLVF